MRFRVRRSKGSNVEGAMAGCSSLATWTTYKNYREQLARYDSVQLEKKTVTMLWMERIFDTRVCPIE